MANGPLVGARTLDFAVPRAFLEILLMEFFFWILARLATLRCLFGTFGFPREGIVNGGLEDVDVENILVATFFWRGRHVPHPVSVLRPFTSSCLEVANSKRQTPTSISQHSFNHFHTCLNIQVANMSWAGMRPRSKSMPTC